MEMVADGHEGTLRGVVEMYAGEAGQADILYSTV
jgi:hypothetical protein